MISFKRSHILIAALSLLTAVVVVKEVFPAIVTTGTSKKVQLRFVLRNVQDFFKTVESSPGVPYIVPTKRKFTITDITICNTDGDDQTNVPTRVVLLTDVNQPTQTLIGDICVRADENVHINYTLGPVLTAGQGLSIGNGGGGATPLYVYISGYEEKG